MTSTTIKYFAFAHLPAALQAVSKPIGELANQMELQLPDGPEKSAGMRKLLEAKDCFVRAALDVPPAGTSTRPAHQQRVIDEAKELAGNIGRLAAFMVTPTFQRLDDAEQIRLANQVDVMRSLCTILEERIAAFPSE